MRARSFKRVAVRRAEFVQDSLGGGKVVYSPPEAVDMIIKPAGGRVLAEIYGLRLSYMLTGYVQLDTAIQEKDGVCIEAAPDTAPDYIVAAIQTHQKHKVVILERREPGAQ